MADKQRRRPSAEISALVILICGSMLLFTGFSIEIWSKFNPTPSSAVAANTSAEPIVPTVTPDGPKSKSPNEASIANRPDDAELDATVSPVRNLDGENGLTDDQFGRIGISGIQKTAGQAWEQGLRWSHTLDWNYKRSDDLPAEVKYWHTLRITEEGWGNFKSWNEVLTEVRRSPGDVWIIGNEPDVKWQDGVSAEIFAERYHEAFSMIKAADITAQVAVGAVSAGTDLRLRYLDDVLSIYEQKYGMQLPTDMWTVHAYVLREEKGSWGIDIPPGMSETSGDLYSVEDHDDLDLFTQQLSNFRRWMAENGYQKLPLVVTEFGILLPNDYGFSPDDVANYMRDTINIMLTETDADFGMPADDNRLVQAMFWFIFYYEQYPTGALWDPETETLSPLGEEMRSFVGR